MTATTDRELGPAGSKAEVLATSKSSANSCGCIGDKDTGIEYYKHSITRRYLSFIAMAVASSNPRRALSKWTSSRTCGGSANWQRGATNNGDITRRRLSDQRRKRHRSGRSRRSSPTTPENIRLLRRQTMPTIMRRHSSNGR